MALGTDDYPYHYGCGNNCSGNDPWGFTVQQCTSFVAWRINNDFGRHFVATSAPGTCPDCWGNGGQWAHFAAQQGFAVDGSPRRGALACALPSGRNSAGHIAVVLSASGGSVTVEDYNWGLNGRYHIHTEPVGTFLYIHGLDPNEGGGDLGSPAVGPPLPVCNPDTEQLIYGSCQPLGTIDLTCPPGYLLAGGQCARLPQTTAQAAGGGLGTAALVLLAAAAGLKLYSRAHPGVVRHDWQLIESRVAAGARDIEQRAARLTHRGAADVAV